MSRDTIGIRIHDPFSFSCHPVRPSLFFESLPQMTSAHTALSRRGLMLGAAAVAAASPAGAAPRPALDYLTVLIAGQSLGNRWFISGSQAQPAFIARMQACGEARPIRFVNCTSPGSAALPVYARVAGNYWLEDDLSPGPKLTWALARIAGLLRKPSCLLWVQGEADSAQYVAGSDDDGFIARECAAILAITQALAGACSPAGVPVFVQRLGPIINPLSGVKEMEFGGLPVYRQAQALVVSRPRYFWGAQPTIELPLVDTVHPTNEAMGWIGGQTAWAMVGRV